jgi:sulfite exporter TauE/SafE
MWHLLTAGFSLGLISSLHCIGMCGPLALALPVQHLSRGRQVVAILLYNFGRTITYSLIGLLFGLLGRSIFLAGWQQGFSVVLGTIMILFAARYFIGKITAKVVFASGLTFTFQRLLGRLFQPRATGGYILPGMINGLLPCGMVYIAIAGAVSTSALSHSILFMFCFGLGTSPAMLALSLFGFRINLSVRRQMKMAMPYLIAVIGVLLILRGLQLGIPFVSPLLPGRSGAALSCHT